MVLVDSSIRDKIFSSEGFYIFKAFLNRDEAIDIRNEVIFNRKCFRKYSNESNHRLFHYPNSPYKYPKWLLEIYRKIMLIKLECCIEENFFKDYCSNFNLNTKALEEILDNISMHTWSCFYWYKDKEMHRLHIDNYGEVAAFLILSELQHDYNSGGLYAYKDKEGDESIYMDKFYEIGDLIIFDQAKIWHEVKPICKTEEQIGRLQFYVPTIPYGYMNDILYFKDFEDKPFYSKKFSEKEKIKLYSESNINSQIHYSRENYFSNWKNLNLA